MVSNGYVGVNDGWQDLNVNNPNPYTMRWAYNSASNGNVAQMGWLSTAGNSATTIAFEVALGFGATQADAIAAASNTLGEDLSAQQSLYDNAWHGYAAGLSTQNGTADDQYYLSAMTLKTMQDKTQRRDDRRNRDPLGFRRRRRQPGLPPRLVARHVQIRQRADHGRGQRVRRPAP